MNVRYNNVRPGRLPPFSEVEAGAEAAASASAGIKAYQNNIDKHGLKSMRSDGSQTEEKAV